MDDDEGLHANENLLTNLDAIDDLVSVEDVEELAESGGEAVAEYTWEPPSDALLKPKLVKLLRDLLSPEIKIYSEASKEFVGLLRSDSGGEVLLEYVKSSPRCAELDDAWRAHRGKPGMCHILSLISALLDQPAGKSRSSGISRNLDDFARSVVGSKLDDVYSELNSQEWRRQSAALVLLASVVRRGMSLASEVVKVFNFKLPVLAKLSGMKRRRSSKEGKEKEKEHRRTRSTRNAFVEFAMSFLEVGNPRLLRWVLQQRDLYSGVLRMLGRDDAETVVYVLSTLRDKVIVPESLLPPGLRSVLFGSVTLEQLSDVSGNEQAGLAADVAHEILVRACTDPANGLMPGLNLKGNEKRLFELMKKLKAKDARYHKDLLLAIVKHRPSLCAVYMDEFPYHLEPRPSSLWFDAVTLAADIISCMNAETILTSLASGPHEDRIDKLQGVLKCIIPRSFTRLAINKGLLHSNICVKHGTLRVILESVKVVGCLISTVDDIIQRLNSRQLIGLPREGIVALHGLPGVSCFVGIDKYLGPDNIVCSSDEERGTLQWVSVKQFIQDEVRALLPDPQVMVKLLSSFGGNLRNTGTLKRCASVIDSGMEKMKKLKSEPINGKSDIVVSGVNDELTTATSESDGRVTCEFNTQEMDEEENSRMVIAKIWHLNEHPANMNSLRDPGSYLNSKLLDVLTFYMRMMPTALDSSFDFFKILPVDPLSLSSDQQQSLLSLLIEFTRQSSGNRPLGRAPELMYRHLQPLITMLVFSETKEIQDQAYMLAQAAMISTGAFDQNLLEVDAWLFFMPYYSISKHPGKSPGAEDCHELSKAVISFLCDAVSTIGNNLYKYMDQMRKIIIEIDGQGDCPGFSPLTICVLQKCLRLLESDSGAFKLHEKSAISLYICNTLNLILQLEGGSNMLAHLIHLLLAEKFKGSGLIAENPKTSLCEWRPIRSLFLFVCSILDQQKCTFFSSSESTVDLGDSSLILVLQKTMKFLEQDHAGRLEKVAVALSSSLLCASPDDILRTFPLVITLVQQHFRSHLQLLSLIFFVDPRFLANVAVMWPDLLLSSLEMLEGDFSYEDRGRGNISTNEAIHPIMKLTSKDATCFIMKLASTDYVDLTEPAAAAFSLFLKQTSFNFLLSAIMSLGSCTLDSTKILKILQSTGLLDLVRVKVSEGLTSQSIYLHCLLFWSHQILNTYGQKPRAVLEELFKLCCTLIENLFEHLVVELSSSSISTSSSKSSVAQMVHDAVDLIFHHPAITSSFSSPLSIIKEVPVEGLGDDAEAFLTSSKWIHPMNEHIFQVMRKVIDLLLSMRSGCSTFRMDVTLCDQILEAPLDLVQKTMFLFKEKFDLCITSRDLGGLLPTFYALHALLQLASPFELLGLIDWMFSKLRDNTSGHISTYVPAVCVALFIADIALDMLYNRLLLPITRSQLSLLLNTKVRDLDLSILQKVHHKILDFAISFNLQSATGCFFKAVNAVYNQKFGKPWPALIPLYMLLCRMAITCPIKMLVHLFCPTNMIKAKTLLCLIEVSPVHLNLFGKTFLGIINRELPSVHSSDMGGTCLHKDEMIVEKCYTAPSEDDFVLLLPAALSYLTHSFHKSQKQHRKNSEEISTFYSRFLLVGFSDWKRYVSGINFHQAHDNLELASSSDFSHLFCNSLLGKAVRMLCYFFVLNGNSVGKERRLKVFDSIYPHSSLSDEILDCDLKMIGTLTYDESLKLANEVVAKISFTKLLLFPSEKLIHYVAAAVDGKFKETPTKQESDGLNFARLRFLNVLVNTLDHIVLKFSLKVDGFITPGPADSYHLFRFLEQSILQNIVQLSLDLQSYLIHLPSIPFLIPFIRSSLIHRFDDPVRLKAIRCVLVTLSKGSFSFTEVLELLVGHSKFVFAILGSDLDLGPSLNTFSGTLLQPLPSILKSLDFTSLEIHTIEDRGSCRRRLMSTYKSGALNERKLELIKLLRILYHVRSIRQTTEPFVGLNSRELVSLLLSGYGATLSEIDLEILYLMHEIESIEGSPYDIISEFDYLWGPSALKFRKELTLDGLLTSKKNADSELIEVQRKRLFRENIPVDSKLCMKTILHVCNDQGSRTALASIEKLFEDISIDSAEKAKMGVLEGYDLAYILRFTIHGLMMGYIEPIEFSRLGLLAVALVSISSADEEIRKLGYASLGRFKNALEAVRNKDALQLQLLLTYMQNGIVEPWQRVPSIIAIFVAEASLILLDPSHNLFCHVSKLLVRSSQLNLKTIPLFDTLFGSVSINFRTDRLWVLQLLYAGLNSNDDAKIFVRNNLLDLLLSFYSSSLSDVESNSIILQIVKKSVKLHTLANYLVKQCGLLPWLSNVIAFYAERLDGDKKECSLKAIKSVLEVIHEVISLRMITDWLQEHALEQLSELSSGLHVLFLDSLKLLKENIFLVNSILHLIGSTLRISQERSIYQPHFALSLEGLFQLFEGFSAEIGIIGSNVTFELGVETLLYSSPVPAISYMEKARLSKLLLWAISAALPSSSNLSIEPNHDILIEEQREVEPHISKLLRWITASVILGSISDKSSKIISQSLLRRPRIESLQSLLEVALRDEDESTEKCFVANEALAVIILYLQQLLGMNFCNLPSVVSALCLLLLSSSVTTELEFFGENRDTIALLCSKIRHPVEMGPDWRWSFDQMWKDNSSDQSEIEEMEEVHACQSLLIIFCNALGGKLTGISTLSHQDPQLSKLFEWERENFLEKTS